MAVFIVFVVSAILLYISIDLEILWLFVVSSLIMTMAIGRTVE